MFLERYPIRTALGEVASCIPSCQGNLPFVALSGDGFAESGSIPCPQGSLWVAARAEALLRECFFVLAKHNLHSIRLNAEKSALFPRFSLEKSLLSFARITKKSLNFSRF